MRSCGMTQVDLNANSTEHVIIHEQIWLVVNSYFNVNTS